METSISTSSISIIAQSGTTLRPMKAKKIPAGSYRIISISSCQETTRDNLRSKLQSYGHTNLDWLDTTPEIHLSGIVKFEKIGCVYLNNNLFNAFVDQKCIELREDRQTSKTIVILTEIPFKVL